MGVTSGSRISYVTLARVFTALLALELALAWFGAAPGFRIALVIALLVTGGILAIRFVRHTLRTTIWRLRNRLYVTYVFIALVPIALILALAATGTWIVAGQVAVYLVSSELDRRAASLENPVRFLSRARAADQPAMIQQLAPLFRERLPGLELLIAGERTLHYPPESTLAAPPGRLKNYTGFVFKGGRYYCASLAQEGRTVVVALAPINAELLAGLVPGIGLLDLNRRDIAGKLPPSASFLDFETPWLGRVQSVVWDNLAEEHDGSLVIQTRPSAVLSALFGGRADDSQTALLFFVIAGLLLLVEALSLVIGVSLTRTITGAVHGLYEGTNRISHGDFAWRIPVNGKDQLAELGHSFNNMTAQLESLIEVAKEKERLQSEIEIASEVQNQLFPRSAPKLRSIELVGICQPARMVSGDYYDYLCLPDGNLALAIGDVAGKGISAALLMASIQSIMRTQLAAGLPVAVATTGSAHAAPHFCTAGVVAQLNRQLFASTAPEKYATFFFGVYDEHSRMLTYTNAGHLPPLLLHNGEVKSLEVTGTVVGAFPAVSYEEQTVLIESGDLLIAYTDGITEPENAYGEEFGEGRLTEVVMRNQNAEPGELVAKIMEAVAHWSTAAELPDDMTVVIARGLA